jgi:hypothetical protein
MIASTLYISITNTQRVNAGSQKVFTETRFLLDQMVNQLQGGAIDYAVGSAPSWVAEVNCGQTFNPSDYITGYPRANQPEPVLSIIKSDGTGVRYCIDQVLGPDGRTRNQLKEQSGSDDPRILSSLTLDISQLDFYIDPQVSDGTGVPSVTIVMEANEVGPPSNPTIFHLQTTVSAGNY